MERPHIDYPCAWEYRVIGSDEPSLRAAVAAVVGDEPYVLTLANQSARARYCSLQLSLEVRDEAQRLDVFERLRRQPAVLYVL